MNKKLLSLAFICAFSMSYLTDACGAPNASTDSLEQRIQTLESQTSLLEEKVTQGESEVRKLWVQRNIQKRNSSELSEANRNINEKIRDQSVSLEKAKEDMGKTAGSALLASNHLQETLNQVKADVNTHALEIQKNSSSQVQYGIVLLILILASWAYVYLFLRKKVSHSEEQFATLEKKIKGIKEETAIRLSEDFEKMVQLSNNLQNPSASSATNHDLIKALADRITFMEMTLFRMDKGVKGYRQLTKSIDQMKDNLLANGYEIVSMLGQPYTDGMKAVTSFIDDETLPSGKRIITSIIKPQINYRGEMIQSAQITVSQNI